MGRLFFKLYSILAIAVALFFIGLASLDKILHNTLETHFTELAQGTYYLLDKQISGLPQNQWPRFIEQLNRSGGYAMNLQKLDKIDLPDADLTRLKNHQLIITTVHHAAYAYHRIQNSPWAVGFPIESSEYMDSQRLSSSTFDLLENELHKQPPSQWPNSIDQLNAHFSFPIQLLGLDDHDLPESEHQHLTQGQIVWQDFNNGTDFLYRRIDKSPHVLKIGPFNEPLTLTYLQTILVICLALLVALAVLFWVIILSRDLTRLSTTAEAFGQGDFSVRTQLSGRSVLAKLAKTFNAMADRIESLICSHKELTNAVSHELRTPIARLRFGMEMLKNAKDDAAKERFMASMNTDINELDQLVAELLTYARFDRDKPALNFQCKTMQPWLDELIQHNATGLNGLTLHNTLQTHANAQFEPKLMARALGNLIQNARRYAHSKINISFTEQQAHYQLCVDDDGPGVPEAQRQHIFDAFTRIDVSRDRDTGGYGLGLAIVQRIAQWHNGEARVEDSDLGGARFIIQWPKQGDRGGAPLLQQKLP